ncbi:MAG: S24/S26 family peptidase [Thermomicrobiales bacterium]|nr:S24/S26 family peptidase [Thermomicrobiales bacterium]
MAKRPADWDHGFADWVRSLMVDAQGRPLSSNAFAERIGSESETVLAWLERGQRPRRAMLSKLAVYAGIPELDALAMAGYATPADEERSPYVASAADLRELAALIRRVITPAVDLPVADQPASASRGGAPPVGSDTVEWLRGQQVILVSISGDCMDPEICAGDVVHVDRGVLFPQLGSRVAVLTDDGEVMVKRVEREKDQFVLADNRGLRFRPHGAVILGKVIAVTKRV